MLSRSLVLKPHRMARFEAGGLAHRRLPTRRPFVVRVDIGSGIETKAGDHGEGMAVARVDRNPPSAAGLAEPPEIRGTHRRFNQTGPAEHVGNSPGTIVGVIIK